MKLLFNVEQYEDMKDHPFVVERFLKIDYISIALITKLKNYCLIQPFMMRFC